MKKIFNKSKIKSLLAVSAISLLAIEPAMAQTGFSGLFSGTLRDQMLSGADFLSAIAYIAGIAFGIKGVLKLKEWNDSKGREATLTQALVPFVAAGILLGLPSMLRVAKGTVTDGSLGGTSIGTGSAIRTIN